MGQAYVVTSGKGGVGKTVTAFNIGVGLSLSGKSVVLIDADINLPNLDKVSGYDSKIHTTMESIVRSYDLKSFIDSEFLLYQMLINDKRFSNLYYIPAHAIYYKNWDFPEMLKRLVWYLKEKFDYVLIDCPSGIDADFENAVYPADKVIVVVTPEVVSVRDADTVIGKLEYFGIYDYMLIINRMDNEIFKNGGCLSIEDIIDILSINLIGIIPEDFRVMSSGNKGIPIITNEKSIAGQAYRNIVKRIGGEQVDFLYLDNEKSRINRIVSKLSNFFADYMAQNIKLHI